MDAVLLFSGQGAQKVGMGKDLYDQYPVAKALIEQADKALGESLSAVMFEGPGEELTRTCNCQPALYVHGLACLAVLKELVPSLNPVAAAGLSLGEFTAHAAAGTYSFEEGLRLVQKRGAFMEEACNATKGTMAAMIGGTDENVIKLAQECDVDVANFNCPGQTVVSGGRCGQGCSRGEGRRLQDCQEAQCGGRLPFPSDAQRYGKAGGRTQEYFFRYAVHACLLQL